MKKGQVLSERYEIVQTIGGGGMANVYLANDLILKRDVAVKVLRAEYADDAEFIKRFDREAQVATGLNHPNIVNIYDVGEDENLLYMVMEYIDGLTLKEYIQQNSPISIEDAMKIMNQITNAISYAHDNGLIHRDVKPQNILIDRAGTIKITDFGIAMALSATSLTQTNSIVGSVHYISPEQARGGTATKKSDIYALGVVLFELLTGKLPFSGDTPVAVALKHLQSDTPSVREINPSIPQSVENIVLRATAKNPLHRYHSAYEMGVAIHEALEPENLHEEKFEIPVEEGEETKVIPIISEEQINHDSQQQMNQTFPNQSDIKAKKKSFFKNKYFLIIAPIVLILILAIILFATLFKTKDVEIPDIVGEYFEDVEQELLELPLKVEQEKMYSEEFEEGVVIKTNPKAGRIVKENSVIKVYISDGEEKVVFDDYVGKNFSQVKRLLEVDYKEVIEWAVPSDEEEGTIINQVQPAPGEEVVPSKTKVIFEISGGPELIKVMRLAGLEVDEAKRMLDESGLKMEVKEEHSDSVEKGKIIRQSPNANSEVKEGTTIEVVVSLGPEEKPPRSQTVSFLVPFEPEKISGTDDNDGEEQYAKEQQVQIFIEDMENSLSVVYIDDVITADKTYSITLIIEPNTVAEYKIVRDGKVFDHQKVPF